MWLWLLLAFAVSCCISFGLTAFIFLFVVIVVVFVVVVTDNTADNVVVSLTVYVSAHQRHILLICLVPQIPMKTPRPGNIFLGKGSIFIARTKSTQILLIII